MRYSRSDTRTRTAVDALAHPDPDRPFLPARRNAQAVPTELSWELLKKLSKELWSTTVDAADMSPGVLCMRSPCCHRRTMPIHDGSQGLRRRGVGRLAHLREGRRSDACPRPDE